MSVHKERAHSKFSASGSERWLNCAASVELEEKSPPSKDTPWSKEGTRAHEVREAFLKSDDWIETENSFEFDLTVDAEMIRHAKAAADKVQALHSKIGGTLLTEKRVYNNEIHPEMFGTCDDIIAVPKKDLHIIDFKYGEGHIVSPEKNTQLIQYALGAAEAYDWDFKNVHLHIMQPRGGSNWHKQTKVPMPMEELRGKWLTLWKKGVARVESGKSKPFAGSWCHWCRAKKICPAKVDSRHDEITKRFNETKNPF